MAHPKPVAVSLVRLEGRLDSETRDETRQRVTEASAASCRNVLVDLRSVTMIDSEGLAVLLAAQHRLETEGRRLLLVNHNDQVERFLRRLGVRELFALFPTPQAALDSLPGGPES